MPKMKFDEAGKRYYQVGVSNVALYVKGSTGYEAGVPWNGVTNITYSPEGAEATSFYADNIEYLKVRSVEKVKASIEAFTAPDEFVKCDGGLAVDTGGAMVLTQQTRATFGLVYLTNKGSDENPDLGQILHVLYGCTASPHEESAATINDSSDIPTMSWDLECVPVSESEMPTVAGEKIRPVAHLKIDLTKLDVAHKTAVINALYGTDGEGSSTGTDATLKTPAQLAALINSTIPE